MLFFIGIELHQLIYELCQGMRLPDPNYCPKRICDLIKSCFNETPNLRPDFNEIKEDLQSSCDALLQVVKTVAGSNLKEPEAAYANMASLMTMKGNVMKSMYFKVKTGNHGEGYATVKKDHGYSKVKDHGYSKVIKEAQTNQQINQKEPSLVGSNAQKDATNKNLDIPIVEQNSMTCDLVRYSNEVETTDNVQEGYLSMIRKK